MKKMLCAEKFCMLPTSLVTNEYSAILNDAEFKILMFYYLKNNLKYGASYYGHKALTTEGYYKISRENYKRVMSSLEAKKLISIEHTVGNRTIVTLLMVPMVDKANGIIYPEHEDVRTAKNVDYYKESWIAVPLKAMDAMLKYENGLSSTEIRLMIKLYRYYMPFSAIDINVFHRSTEEIYVAPRIMHDLDISKEQCDQYTNNLVKAGLISWRSILAYNEKFDHETRLRIASSAMDSIIELHAAIPTWKCDWEEQNE